MMSLVLAGRAIARPTLFKKIIPVQIVVVSMLKFYFFNVPAVPEVQLLFCVFTV